MTSRLAVPYLGEAVPRRGNRFSKGLGWLWLRLLGWGFSGEIPNLAQCVIVVAPHTSNWDFVVGLAAKLALGIRVDWLGKHTIFRWPLGVVWRWLGGIPIDRRAAGGVVEAASAAFRQRERLFLALSPEGTRRKVEKWKSGFYRIGQSAGVPLLPVALDYGNRKVAFFPIFRLTGDYEADLTRLQACFRADMARRPDQY